MKKVLSVLLAVCMLCGVLSVCSAAADRHPVNVILMIGDGMGPNHLELAKQERGISLYMEDACDARGFSKTRSVSSKVTDSAAGGTALATGVRTTNRYVASYFYDPLGWFSVPVTLCEAAKQSGRRSGVITTDTTDGATPASFTSHTSDRGNSEDITTQQETSDFDIVWGASTSSFDADLAVQNNFTVVTTLDEMNALEEGGKSFGQFDYETMWRTKAPDGSVSPTLSQMTAKAISLLDNENGFFLMVEGAHIDKWSHSSNEEDNYDTKVANAAEAVEEFDNAIRIAAEFAKRDGNTIVVITADHETGGIVKNDEGKYVYTQTSHSGVDVPLIVFDSDQIVADGEHIENRQVAQRIGKAMSLGSLFPAKAPGKLPIFFANLCEYLTQLFYLWIGLFKMLFTSDIFSSSLPWRFPL